MLFLIFYSLITVEIECFIPASFMNSVVENLNKEFHENFGEISATLTHEEILKRGKYFYHHF
jgi:hypothetical protein